VGLHFFNPVHRVNCSRCARAREPAAHAGAVREVDRRMSRECVTVRSRPGS
jgi:hypothetical protein